MPDALIFDIDGTLLDSVDLHARAWEETFQHFGYNIPFAKIRGQIGKGGDQLLPFLLDADKAEKQGKEMEKFRGNLFKEKFRKDVKPFPGVRALFEKAIANNQKVALASSAKADELEYYKKLAKIDDLIHAETSSSDAEKSKPEPDIFEVAVDRLGSDITPDKVLIIGDSPYDVEAATKAGIRTVCVRCGGFPESELKNAGCIAIYDGPEDLLKNYDSSPLAPGTTRPE